MFEYIKYQWKAKGRHGTHSPFIYKMVDECFRFPFDNNDQLQLKSFLNDLQSDGRIIEVADFGAGSRRLKNRRKIKEIYKVSSSKGRFAKLFYQLAGYYRPMHILELGTSLGVGTAHLALGNKASTITTVEACPQTATLAKDNFVKLGVENVNVVNQTFGEFIPSLTNEVFDIIFVDGHHDGEATINYVRLLQKHVHDETLIILDDIRWSDSMFKAWNQLVEEEQFHVSIDFFRMGMLVKKPTQRKEHFIVKFWG